MKNDINNAYMSGIGCSIIASFCGIIAFESGWNTTGQFLAILTIVFGALGLGSFIKPKNFGPLASHILKNILETISENTQEQNAKSFKQKSGKNGKNIQGETVNINYYNDTKTKRR